MAKPLIVPMESIAYSYFTDNIQHTYTDAGVPEFYIPAIRQRYIDDVLSSVPEMEHLQEMYVG